MNDNRVRIQSNGVGVVSFDPLGLKADNFTIILPHSFTGRNTVKLICETPNGEKVFDIKELIEKGISTFGGE